MKTILSRLERLEQNAHLTAAVSIMQMLDSGAWVLTCNAWRGEAYTDVYQTEAEARAAYSAFLRRCKKGRTEPALIIIDV